MMQERLLEYQDAAVEAGWKAAAVLEEWRPRFQTREKGRFDLVTDADLASQDVICKFFRERYPDHDFLGEEEGLGVKRPGPDAPPTWIVDPIDGTTNYVHDCPLYCISIGLQIAGELVVGVVLDPSRREVFKAARGHGAWLNDRRLHVSGVETLEESLAATGFAADPQKQGRSLDVWRFLSARVQSLRRTGSTAINMAYVAAGRFDVYYGFDNNVWDIAGGVVLVREAGGVVTQVSGSLTYDPYQADSIVANPVLHAKFVDCLKNI